MFFSSKLFDMKGKFHHALFRQVIKHVHHRKKLSRSCLQHDSDCRKRNAPRLLHLLRDGRAMRYMYRWAGSMNSPHGTGMKHSFLRINIALLAILFGLIAGIDVQAKDGIETAGDILVVALPVAAVGLTIGFKDGQGTLQFGESAALAIGSTLALKFTIDKTRPDGDNQSFPSAHAALSFTSAEFIRKRYGWEYGLPAYALATFISYSRVEADRHYPIDVIAGAAIGIVSSYLFTRPYKGWSIQPEAGYSFFGIRLSHSL
jgi:membrane-associated phospholipid phosphatase